MTNRYCEWTSQPGCRRSLPFRDRPARRGESRRARLPLAPSLPAVPQGNVNRCHRKGVGHTRFRTTGGDVRIGGGIAAVDAARGDGAPVAGGDRRRLSAGRAARPTAPLPLVDRDFQIATACALSFAAFFARHAAIFESTTSDAVCESYFSDNELEVRFTAPHDGLGTSA